MKARPSRSQQTMTADQLIQPVAQPTASVANQHELLGPCRSAAQRLISIHRLLHGTPSTRATQAYVFPHTASIWIDGLLNVALRDSLRAQCADGESYVVWQPVGDRVAYAVLPADGPLVLSVVARRLAFD
jgi:hypothetical protein